LAQVALVAPLSAVVVLMATIQYFQQLHQLAVAVAVFMLALMVSLVHLAVQAVAVAQV
jgi:hypothetical protein